MPPILSKLGNKTLHSQTREVVNNVHSFMKREAAAGHVLIPLEKVQMRVVRATGVSERSLRRVLTEGFQCEEQGTSFGTPGKRHSVPKRVTNPDDFDVSVIRRTIYDFYTQEKTVPTVRKLLAKLKESINFKGGSTSLKLILRKMGFKWKQTRSNRAALIERDDIRSKRVAYLRAIKRYRSEGRPIIYEDETFIHSSHTTPKNWTDDTPSGYMAPVSKGQRLIIVHAGGRTGFVPGALLIFKSHLKTGDYHSEMNSKNYEKWLREKLIPNLPPKSVLVIDNAPYHNIEINKAPTSQATKAKMKEWLRENNVPFHDGMLKIQLYDLVKTHKPLLKNYVIDSIMAAHGHAVIRLPPYHPDLNPIELVWADIKQSVGAENVSFKLDDVKKNCEKWFTEFGLEKWGKVCDHAEKIENEYIENEGIREDAIERIVIADSVESSDSETDMTDHSENSESSGLSGVELLDQ